MVSRAVHRQGTKALWFTRIRVILACGLVFGVSATVSLASWNDSEFAKANFTAGLFDVQSASAGPPVGNWTDTPAGDPLLLTFTPQTGLVPGAVVAAGIGVRVKAGSVGGTIKLPGPPTATRPGTTPFLADYLKYRAYQSSSASCEPEGRPQGPGAGWMVGDASTFVALTESSATTAPLAAATKWAPGNPTWVCFQVMLDPGAPPAINKKTSTVTWQLLAQAGVGS